jgi:hypothetical protein
MSTEGTVGGAVGGGLAGAPFGPIGIGIGALAGGLLGSIGSGSQSYSQPNYSWLREQALNNVGWYLNQTSNWGIHPLAALGKAPGGMHGSMIHKSRDSRGVSGDMARMGQAVQGAMMANAEKRQRLENANLQADLQAKRMNMQEANLALAVEALRMDKLRYQNPGFFQDPVSKTNRWFRQLGDFGVEQVGKGIQQRQRQFNPNFGSRTREKYWTREGRKWRHLYEDGR